MLNFPNSPSLNDVYAFEERAWQWNGRAWTAYKPVLPGIYDLIAGRDVSIQGDLNSGGDVSIQGDLNSGGNVNLAGDLSLEDSTPFTTTLQLVTATANRVISFPDITGTVALVAGSSGQLTYNLSGAQAGLPGSSVDLANNTLTLASRVVNTLGGGASFPPISLTGTWFTGGTSTTTKPHVLIEPVGTASTTWSTSGTGLGINATSGFIGNLLDVQVGGVSQAKLTSSGNLLLGVNNAPVVRTDITDITGADTVVNVVSLTQAQYDAIVSPSATTLYVIKT
jgi:hypothetical protein